MFNNVSRYLIAARIAPIGATNWDESLQIGHNPTITY